MSYEFNVVVTEEQKQKIKKQVDKYKDILDNEGSKLKEDWFELLISELLNDHIDCIENGDTIEEYWDSEGLDFILE